MLDKDKDKIRLLKNDKAHAHRYKDVESVTGSFERPIAPDYLSDRAKEIFNEFVERVEQMYQVSDTDLDTFVLYANNQEQLEMLENVLRVEGVTYELPTQYGITLKARPEVAMHKQCKDLQLRILKEFGLTPGSRSRVKIPKKVEKKENPFAAIGEKQKQG